MIPILMFLGLAGFLAGVLLFGIVPPMQPTPRGYRSSPCVVCRRKGADA